MLYHMTVEMTAWSFMCNDILQAQQKQERFQTIKNITHIIINNKCV